MKTDRTIDRLLRQQSALAKFGSFAFGETDLQKVLTEAALICALSLDVPFSKICRYRVQENDLLIVAGYGWEPDLIGHTVSQADETSTQGRAFTTGEPVILEDVRKNNSYKLPPFYAEHGIISTIDVLIKGRNGPFGVLELDCTRQRTFDEHDVNFLIGFANVLAEAVQTAERAAGQQAVLAEIRKLSEEKDVLAAELQHRVRNNLQLVYGMLIRQIELPEKDAREGVRSIARRVMSLATIYDHLLGHGLVQKIDFGAYVNSLCASLADFQQRGAVGVELTCETEFMPLDLDLLTSLGIVVTEIVSNAYLHAFPGGSGNIRVVLVRRESTGILTISDDGTGFVPQTESKRHGVGLIKRLMEQAKGSGEVRSCPGTVWTLSFPLPPQPAVAAAHGDARVFH